MTVAHLVHNHGNFIHIPIWVLCLDINFPNITIVTPIYSKGTGNNWGFCLSPIKIFCFLHLIHRLSYFLLHTSPDLWLNSHAPHASSTLRPGEWFPRLDF